MKGFLKVFLVLLVLAGLGAFAYYAFQPVAMPREGGVIEYEFPVPANARYLVEEDGYKKWLLTYTPLYDNNVDVAVQFQGELTEGYIIIEMVRSDESGLNKIESKQIRVDAPTKIAFPISLNEANGTVNLNIWYKDDTKGHFTAEFVEHIRNYTKWLQ